MKKHVDEGILQALLDGELSPPERADAEAHLAACPACAGELRALRTVHERMDALLARADAPAPVAQAQMRFRSRRAQVRERPRFAEARWALPRAAVLVLGLAGAAAAASIPGSPVRAWIEDVVLPAEQDSLGAEVAEHPAPAAPAPAPAAEVFAGVSRRVESGGMRVVVSGAREGLELRVRLAGGDAAEVHASDSGARFRSSSGRIEVADAGAGVVTVSLPRGAGPASVEVNGRVYVAKEGAALRALVPAEAQSPPEELVFRVGG